MWDAEQSASASTAVDDPQESVSSISFSDTRTTDRESMLTFTNEMEEELLEKRTEEDASTQWLSVLLAWLLTIVRFVIPSFLQDDRSGGPAAASSERNRAQAALDGLRGLACLIVSWVYVCMSCSHKDSWLTIKLQTFTFHLKRVSAEKRNVIHGSLDEELSFIAALQGGW